MTTFIVEIIYIEYRDIQIFIVFILFLYIFNYLILLEESHLKEILARCHLFPVQSSLKDKESFYQQVRKILTRCRECLHRAN